MSRIDWRVMALTLAVMCGAPSITRAGEAAQRDITAQVQTDGDVIVSEHIPLDADAGYCGRDVYAWRGVGLPEQTASLISMTLNGQPVHPDVTPFADPGGGTSIEARAPFSPSPRSCELVYRLHGAIRRELDGRAYFDWLPLTMQRQGWTRLGTLRIEWPPALDPAQLQLTATSGTGPTTTDASGITIDTTAGASTIDVANLVMGDAYLHVVASFPGAILTAMPAPERVPGMRNGGRWLAALIGYYLLVSLVFARRQDLSPVIAEYQPPDDLSPALMRYLWLHHWDATCFASALLGLATKGVLRIAGGGEGDHDFTLSRGDTTGAAKLQPDERALLATLFARGAMLPIGAAARGRLIEAQEDCSNMVIAHCQSSRLMDNAGWLIPGWLLALAATLMTVLPVGGVAPVLAFALVVMASVPQPWYRVARFLPTPMAAIAIIGLPLAAAAAIWLLPAIIGPTRLWVVAAVGVVQLIATWSLLRLVGASAKLKKRIDGFRWYLQTAELQNLESRFKTDAPEHIVGSRLAYAAALDLHVPWSHGFVAAVTRAVTPPDEMR